MILTHGANSLKKSKIVGYVTIGGRDYPYVKIGNLFWLAENLQFVPNEISLDPSQVNYGIPAAFYYDNDPNNIDMGMYYTWWCTSLINDYLPDGWRVPLTTDVDNLINYLQYNGLDSYDLRVKPPEWNGTNKTGMSIINSGGGSSSLYVKPSFSRGNAIFWTKENYSTDYAIRFFLRENENTLLISSTRKEFVFSIRICKNAL